jgi:hypothetical protein
MTFLNSLLKNKSTSVPASWSAKMGWRFVTYSQEQGALSFQIEPMVKGPDVVYVPDQATWAKAAPAWAQPLAPDILARLKSVAWKRELLWQESDGAPFLKSDKPVPGSIESTKGGQYLEQQRMFDPNSPFTHAQCHEVWHQACRKFAGAASGRVTLFASTVIPDSVFQAVELPALRANPNVTLDFK